MNWWTGLTDLQHFFVMIAFPATLVLIIQFILLLFGFADGDGADDAIDPDDLDFDNEPSADLSEYVGDTLEGDSDGIDEAEDGQNSNATLRLFTLRSLVAFFSVGGWTGVVAIDRKAPEILAIFLAFTAGCLAMYFVAWTVRLILRMQHSGNVQPENAIGKEGEVYLRIPNEGIGKVNVIVQDRLCEMNATTRAGRDIKTGEKVIVLGVVSDGLLLVTPYTAPDGAEIKKYEEVM